MNLVTNPRIKKGIISPVADYFVNVLSEVK